jgi:hypothetical protein
MTNAEKKTEANAMIDLAEKNRAYAQQQIDEAHLAVELAYTVYENLLVELGEM